MTKRKLYPDPDSTAKEPVTAPLKRAVLFIWIKPDSTMDPDLDRVVRECSRHGRRHARQLGAVVVREYVQIDGVGRAGQSSEAQRLLDDMNEKQDVDLLLTEARGISEESTSGSRPVIYRAIEEAHAKATELDGGRQQAMDGAGTRGRDRDSGEGVSGHV